MAYINLPNDPVSGNFRDGEDYAKGSYVYANDKAIVDEVNGNLDNVNIKSSANIAVSKISGTAVNLTSEQVVENKNFINCTIGTNKFDLEKALVPIGTIVPIYDFSGALTFDSDYYAYCNGQTKTIGGVSRTLPDLANRYIVGFGVEGAGTGANGVGNATWSTDPVGNASHQFNLEHTHITDIGSFTSGSESSHTHNYGTYAVNPAYTYTSYEGSHTHASGSYAAAWYRHPTNDDWQVFIRSSMGFDSSHKQYFNDSATPVSSGGTASGYSIDVIGTSSAGTNHRHTVNIATTSVTGNSGSGSSHSHSVNPPETTSTSSLSATEPIQPRSIRCRYIMRIK